MCCISFLSLIVSLKGNIHKYCDIICEDQCSLVFTGLLWPANIKMVYRWPFPPLCPSESSTTAVRHLTFGLGTSFMQLGGHCVFLYGLACVAIPWTVWRPLIYKRSFQFLVYFETKTLQQWRKYRKSSRGMEAKLIKDPQQQTTTTSQWIKPVLKSLINGDSMLYLYVSEDSQPWGIESPSLQRQSLAPCLFLQGRPGLAEREGGERVFVCKLVY